MLWHIGPQSDPEVEALVISAGLELDEEEPGMFARLDTPRATSPLPGLRIEPVRDLETLRRWVDILSGSRLVEETVPLRAALGLDASAACQHLIGYLDDEAVATAAVYRGTRASEIQHVVTLDQHRRRGIGTAITAAALELARRHGSGCAVLTASPDGEGLYRRLGFVTVCSVRRFLQRPSSPDRGSRLARRRRSPHGVRGGHEEPEPAAAVGLAHAVGARAGDDGALSARD